MQVVTTPVGERGSELIYTLASSLIAISRPRKRLLLPILRHRRATKVCEAPGSAPLKASKLYFTNTMHESEEPRLE